MNYNESKRLADTHAESLREHMCAAWTGLMSMKTLPATETLAVRKWAKAGRIDHIELNAILAAYSERLIKQYMK